LPEHSQQSDRFRLRRQTIAEAMTDRDRNNTSFGSSRAGKADYNAAYSLDPRAVSFFCVGEKGSKKEVDVRMVIKS